MTFSTLLNRGSSSLMSGDRFDISGSPGVGDRLAYMERGLDRGSYGGGGGGKGKGGSKGNQTALSALTLLAFLFFINMLQSCLKDMSTSDMTMMIISNVSSRIRPRPKREIANKGEPAASPGSGAYWNSNVLVHRKGDAGEDFIFAGDYTTESQEGNRLQEAFEEDYDYPDTTESKRELEHVPTTNNIHQQENPAKEKHTKQLDKAQDLMLDEQWKYRDGNIGQFNHVTFHQNDKQVAQYADPLKHFWGMTSFMHRIVSSMDISQCYELVMCEVHRASRNWGEPGLLVASGLSEAFLWIFGADEPRRRAVLEAAENGRVRRSCGIHIQQCQDRSKDRSLLPILAIFVEQFS